MLSREGDLEFYTGLYCLQLVNRLFLVYMGPVYSQLSLSICEVLFKRYCDSCDIQKRHESKLFCLVIQVV